MNKLCRSFASVLRHSSLPTRCLATTTTKPNVIAPVAPSVVYGDGSRDNVIQPVEKVPLQSWSGADVQVVLHESFENMVVKDIVSLPGMIFNASVRPDLVHRVVTWQLAKRRAGTAKTKDRSEVSGSGRKIRPQKGTGRSRQGARTSPIFRGGGTVHGPRPRDYYYPLPCNVRRNGLRSVLTSKLLNGQLWIVESASIADGKTKSVIRCMDRYGWKSALIIDDIENGVAGVDPLLHRASHAVWKTLPMNVLGLNVYDSLSFDNLVMTTNAVEKLTERFSKYEWLF